MQLVWRLVLNLMAAMLLLISAGSNAYASVWTITSDWNPTYEIKYGQWIASVTQQPPTEDGKIQSPLFLESGPLHGLPVDCADFVYATRAIFAAENGLPFVSKASLNGKRLDASKNYWDSVPKEKRLRAFLKDVFFGAGTASLLLDTVAITEISREKIGAGSILLAAPNVGHAWMIRAVRATGIPELVFASVPALEELFYRDGLPRGEAVFSKLQPGSNQAGFRSFCIPGKSCPATTSTKSVWSRHADWRPMVLRSLQIRPEPLIESIGREMKNICREAKARSVLVTKAAEFKFTSNRCLRGSDYYNYSTENRDSRFKESFLDLWELWMTTNDLMDESRLSGRMLPKPLVSVLDQISQVFSDGIIDENFEDLVCPVQVSATDVLSLRDLRQHSLAGRFSPDPNESVRARWGLAPEQGVCLPHRN